MSRGTFFIFIASFENINLAQSHFYHLPPFVSWIWDFGVSLFFES